MFYMISKKLEVVNILKKTKAYMFKDLKIGDMIQCKVPIESVGRNKGTYAVGIYVENLNTKDYTIKTFNELGNIFSLFEFKEIV